MLSAFVNSPLGGGQCDFCCFAVLAVLVLLATAITLLRLDLPKAETAPQVS
jgi:hypothetical protein